MAVQVVAFVAVVEVAAFDAVQVVVAFVVAVLVDVFVAVLLGGEYAYAWHGQLADELEDCFAGWNRGDS